MASGEFADIRAEYGVSADEINRFIAVIEHLVRTEMALPRSANDFLITLKGGFYQQPGFVYLPLIEAVVRRHYPTHELSFAQFACGEVVIWGEERNKQT